VGRNPVRLGLPYWNYSRPSDPTVEFAEQLAERVLPRLADVG